MRSKFFRLRHFALSALVPFAGACAEIDSSSPMAPTAPARASAPSATLIECSTSETLSTSRTIDLLGGTIKLTDSFGGTHEVVFPANAVSAPTTFTLTVPASKYVKVDVTATDPLTGKKLDVNFGDAKPTLAISYKRCTRANVDLDKNKLHLYNVDPTTNVVLEGPFGSKEGSSTDPRVKGQVPHFSEYAVGSPD